MCVWKPTGVFFSFTAIQSDCFTGLSTYSTKVSFHWGRSPANTGACNGRKPEIAIVASKKAKRFASANSYQLLNPFEPWRG